jgi:hypothetical protein
MDTGGTGWRRRCVRLPRTIYHLIGQRVIKVEKIYDYWQFVTADCGINIYNPAKYSVCNNGVFELTDLQIPEIVNRIITKVTYKKHDCLCLDLDNKNSILVPLIDEAFCGPEAASFHFKTGEIIVIQY